VPDDQRDMRRICERPDGGLRLQRHSVHQILIGRGVVARSDVDPERHGIFLALTRYRLQRHGFWRIRFGIGKWETYAGDICLGRTFLPPEGLPPRT